MNERAWYRRWFGEDYLLLYSHRSREEARRQVALARRLWGEPLLGGLLDVACGSGRHTRAFAEAGVRAVGLDLSFPLLRISRLEPGPPFGIVRGDMRSLPFPAGAFAAVVSFFTSIGYFGSDAEEWAVLREMARVLAPGGRLLLDTFNPGPTIEGLVAAEERTLSGRRIRIRRWYDSSSRRLEKEILFRVGGEERRYHESVRAFEPTELAAMAAAAGLERVEVVGGENDGRLASSPLDVAPRLLLLARKPELRS